MKHLILTILLLITCILAAEATPQQMNLLVPLSQFDQIAFDSQRISTTSAGIMRQTATTNLVALYSYHTFSRKLAFNYPTYYHTFDMLWDRQHKRHQYLAIFKTESDQPVYGGWHTLTGALSYGYKVIYQDDFSLTLGGGLGLGDFGIEYDGGKTWPLIPVPLIRLQYHKPWLDASFDFITSPNLSMTLGPESRLRFVGDLRFDQLRDERDLIFETSLAWRFFSPDSPKGDFAGISAGIKSDNYTSYLGDKDEIYEMQYYAAFASIDITLLKLTAGYQFNGRELYREELQYDTQDGIYLSLQAMYPIQ